MGRIEGHVSSSRLQHCGKRDRHVHRAIDAHRHEGAAADADSSQKMREGVGAPVERLVGQGLSFVQRGDGGRAAPGRSSRRANGGFAGGRGRRCYH